jgi:hypothetical protein
MIKGPMNYVPPVTVETVEEIKVFPLGNYKDTVNDIQTGKIRKNTGMFRSSFQINSI